MGLPQSRVLANAPTGCSPGVLCQRSAVVFQVLPDDFGQGGRGGEAEGGGAGAVDGLGPVVDDALDAGIEGVGEGAEGEAAFGGDFPEDGLGEGKGPWSDEAVKMSP